MAFYDDSSLTDVTIGSGLTKLDNYQFYRCSSLEDITIPDNVTSLGNYTFAGCKNLSHVDLPETLETIGNAAFADCDSLAEVTIPKSVTSIGSNAFGYKIEKDSLVKGNDITIKGNNNTAAKDYADSNDLTFDALDPVTTTETSVATGTTTTETSTETGTETSASAPTQILYGDANLDGRVDITDSVVLNKAAAGAVQLSDSARANADCNADGVLGSEDATILMQFLVKLIDQLPYTE